MEDEGLSHKRRQLIAAGIASGMTRKAASAHADAILGARDVSIFDGRGRVRLIESGESILFDSGSEGSTKGRDP